MQLVEERDFELQPTDNLIIKGNNLLALHSLKERFKGQVKLIYIDPPYNTGNDGFKYNDSFNHATWLTFMRNRLEIAKELLTEDGFIFVSIDDNEQAYLKVLMDEVFERQNFVSGIIIQTNKGGRDYLPIAVTHEHLLCYTKNINKCEINELSKDIEHYKFEDSNGKYEIRELRNRNPRFNKSNRPNLYYPVYIDESSKDENGFCLVSLEQNDQYTQVTFPLNSAGEDSCWRWGRDKFIANNFDTLDATQIVAKQKKDGGWNIYEKNRKSTFKVKSIWDESEMRTEKGTIDLRKLFNGSVFAHPKPVDLIKRCIQIGSDENDIVLDFHAGSGTTAQAVLELNKEEKGSNRQFILVEQMDYIQTVTAERVKKVMEINGEGSFVYCELMQLNAKYIDQIEEATTSDQLKTILANILSDGYIKYKVDPEVCKAEFDSIEGIENQKQALIDILDKNYLYVNYSEINDRTNQVSDEDKAFNKQFYGDAQ